MLLKKFSYLLLSALLVTSVACKDDDDPVVADTTAPTATFTSPTEDQLSAGFGPGGSFTITGTVVDDMGLKSATLATTGPDAASVAWGTNNWSEADVNNSKSLPVSFTVQIPENAAPGIYTTTFTAVDNANNASTPQTWTFEVGELSDEMTFTITIPEALPEGTNVYIAGEFANPDGTAATWSQPGTNAGMMMTRIDDTNYTITLPYMDSGDTPDGIIEYKFFRGEGWGNGEVLETCEGAPNRTFTLPAHTLNNDIDDITIPAWENFCG
jgi:hypothetical protein